MSRGLWESVIDNASTHKSASKLVAVTIQKDGQDLCFWEINVSKAKFM